ncbi:hsp70 family protein [Gigaspora margarita]|uniref:Hsp70 family protein n=1 Tax=Gigaspora margarita TaxID=4874 RepID=A0A8H4EVQ9_GIGMA|nr:hsp70 family protein [Gigaspora margarita]
MITLTKNENKSSEPNTGSNELNSNLSEPNTGLSESTSDSSEPNVGLSELILSSSEPNAGLSEPTSSQSDPNSGSSQNENSGNENDKNFDNENKKIGITIKIKDSKDSKDYFRRLPQKIKLDKVRNLFLKNEYDGDIDFNMGSNCRFLKNNAMIRLSDEPEFGLLEIVEKTDDGNHYLYVTQHAEFDLTQLRFEKGFRINKDGSVTSASFQAFKINYDEIKIVKKTKQCEGLYECKHVSTAECKRSLIFDVKFSAAFSEWVSTSIGLSHENSDQTTEQYTTYTRHSHELIIRGIIDLPILDKNIIVEKNFIEEVEKIVNDTSHDNDKISKLCEISEKYGHFYARRLILGGAIIRNEEYTENSADDSKTKTTNAQVGVGIRGIFKSEVNAVRGNKDMNSNSNSNTYNDETIIGGTNYSQDDKIPWRQSLNDATNWRIIGYEGVYSLFDLLDKELQKKVLSVMGHQILEANVKEIIFDIKRYEKKHKKPYIYELLITNQTVNISECNILASIESEKNNVFSLHIDYVNRNKNRPVIVIHHIHGEQTKFKLNHDVKIKLGWIIFGPPTSFDFSIQYPLIFKSGKYQPLRENNYSIINNCGMFGTCVLEAVNIAPQVENSSNEETATSDQILYNPKDSTFAIGNYLTRYQDSVRQESALLFVYDVKNKEKVTDEQVLKRLSLYSW